MGELVIIFAVITAVSAGGLGVMFFASSPKVKSMAFYMMAIWAIVLAAMNLISLPVNYTTQRILAGAIGMAAAVAVFLEVRTRNMAFLAKCIVAASIAATLYRLFVS